MQEQESFSSYLSVGLFVGYNIVTVDYASVNEHIHCRHVVTYLFHDRLTDRR